MTSIRMMEERDTHPMVEEKDTSPEMMEERDTSPECAMSARSGLHAEWVGSYIC